MDELDYIIKVTDNKKNKTFYYDSFKNIVSRTRTTRSNILRRLADPASNEGKGFSYAKMDKKDFVPFGNGAGHLWVPKENSEIK